MYNDILKEIFKVIYAEQQYIPKKELYQVKRLYRNTTEDFNNIINYIEGNLSKDKDEKLKDLVEKYYEDIEDYCRYNEEVHFLAGFEYGVKLMSSLYNR